MKHSGTELERLSEVIGLIYEGAIDPARWTKDILPAMAEYIDAPGCLLFSSLHTPQNGGYFFMHGIAQDHIDLYMNKYQTEDIWTIAALQQNLYREGNVAIADEFLPRERVLASNFYKEWIALDKNMGQLLASVVFGADSTTALPSVCSYVRGLHHPNFSDTERHRQQLLLPHISRSLGVMQRLRSAELTVATTRAALDRLLCGVLLLDNLGRVAFANQSAQRLIERGDGLRLRKFGHAAGLSELDTEDTASSNAIRAAIKTTLRRDPYATPHFSQSVVVPRSTGFGHYTVQFSALGNQSEFGGGSSGHAAIVFIADSTSRPSIDPAALQNAYGLTAGEARVALTLVEHVSAKEAAQILGVSPHTVRSQIKQIYAKLGVDTRTRFVRVMLGLAGHAP